jgi:ketosteroid isomerase-like protein
MSKKIVMRNGILLTILLLSVFPSCKNTREKTVSGNEDQTDSIRFVIQNAIGWAKNKDFDLLYSIIPDDPNYIEVDPGNMVIKGFTQFKENEAFWGDPGFKAIRYEIRDLKISVSQSGTVAWYYCILDDINEWKGKPASWINTRWTGVLEKRNRKWVIVQMHFSFAKD